jgi:hypothetical protein
MADDTERPKDESDYDDAFDYVVGQVLVEEADLLSDLVDHLIETGSISVERPNGALTAYLRAPGGLRPGELVLRATAAHGSGSGRVPVSPATYRDLPRLRSEITLQLAVELAWLAEQQSEEEGQ